MAFPKRHLSDGEYVVDYMRTHPKVLGWRILGTILLITVAIIASVIAHSRGSLGGFTQSGS